MPIDYKEYHPKWKLISRLIKIRDENCCMFCKAPNHQLIFRDKSGAWHLAPEGHEIDAMAMDGIKFIKVILTVAHLDHDKTNNRFNNLAALCQKCHLNYDIKHHIQNRKFGRNWKKAQTKLNFE